MRSKTRNFQIRTRRPQTPFYECTSDSGILANREEGALRFLPQDSQGESGQSNLDFLVWVNIPKGVRVGERGKAESGNTLEWAQATLAPPRERHQELGTGQSSAGFNLFTSTGAVSTLLNQVVRWKHAVSLSPGCSHTSPNSLLNWNHLTAPEKWSTAHSLGFESW